MPLVQDSAICIRKFEFSETSQVLTLLTRNHGVVRVIAKGAHRRTKAGASKFDGGIDLLDLGVAVFSLAPERDLPPLTEWTIRSGHSGLRKSLRAMHLALYAAELCALLVGEHDPHPVVFNQLDHLLAELATPRQEEAFVAFELDLLNEAGLLPELGRCAQCAGPLAKARVAVAKGAGARDGAKEGAKDGAKKTGDAQGGSRAYFSARRGGAVCPVCADAAPDRRPIDGRLLRLAAGIVGLPHVDGIPQRLPKLTRRQTDPLNALLADYVQHTLARPLKLPRYVLE
jgi:DNA repair protein RecO (recombination protein O)